MNTHSEIIDLIQGYRYDKNHLKYVLNTYNGDELTQELFHYLDTLVRIVDKKYDRDFDREYDYEPDIDIEAFEREIAEQEPEYVH